MRPEISLKSAELGVDISLFGAELRSLRTAPNMEWLWQGDPASWPRQAPVLFPVIGRCAGGGVRHRGRFYPIPLHGYAPESTFDIVAVADGACTLRLDPSEATRRVWPFELRLEVAFALDGPTLRQTASVTNLGGETAAAAFGFHPGFAWPTPSAPGAAQTDSIVLFEREETAPIRRLRDGLLGPEPFPNEIEGRTLRLSPELFTRDAMFFDRPASRSVWFGTPGAPGVEVEFPDCPQLGLWMRPGARFLCIEPWQGHDHPLGFDGDVLESPGMVRLEPGESFTRHLAITPGALMPA
ncbi:aldose 1-epimerase family protein [Alsobacter sp. SYSU M60028]|uniref:Aldose 1-epimerase family protein n=1 Tax=Alsobacter ponti TaxID=2962936 RepID=A0ABT1LHN7_9HYPH|nr:aldose 1-epimerase family protein [Alsobacter ponti]MCP8941022.1 aldose 1-epimerase family protein [Alsobacter ponti]